MSNRKMNSASIGDENRFFPINQDGKGKVDNQPVSLQRDEEDEIEDDELTEEDFAIDETEEDSEDDQ